MEGVDSEEVAFAGCFCDAGVVDNEVPCAVSGGEVFERGYQVVGAVVGQVDEADAWVL